MQWVRNRPVCKISDGERYLVAVKVRTHVNPGFRWEYGLVTVRVEELDDPWVIIFNNDGSGECRGWKWEDVKYFIPLDDLSPELTFI